MYSLKKTPKCALIQVSEEVIKGYTDTWNKLWLSLQIHYRLDPCFR